MSAERFGEELKSKEKQLFVEAVLRSVRVAMNLIEREDEQVYHSLTTPWCRR